MRATVYTCTRLGGDHVRNQDRALIGQRVVDTTDGIERADVVSPVVLGVFDGLGGHAAGDIASDLAAGVVADAPPPEDERTITELLHRADRALLDAMDAAPERSGMGTTVAVLILGDEQRPDLVANVGDSTVWRLRPGEVEELSTSDRWQGSGVLQCLGANADGVHPHVRTAELTAGDRVLIATDGLTDVVPPSVVQEEINGEPQRAAEQLLSLVEAAGLPDDVSFVLVDVHG